MPGQRYPDAVYLRFDTTGNQVIDAKAGISYVSAAGARNNWRTENPGWDFGATRDAAQAAWNGLLGRVAVAGGTAWLTIHHFGPADWSRSQRAGSVSQEEPCFYLYLDNSF